MRLFVAILLVGFSANLSWGRADGLSAEQTKAAQKLYTAKCAKCHKFYDPNGYQQAEWDLWMQKMKKKSKLKADQFELLSRYLDTVRAEKKADANTR